MNENTSDNNPGGLIKDGYLHINDLQAFQNSILKGNFSNDSETTHSFQSSQG